MREPPLGRDDLRVVPKIWDGQSPSLPNSDARAATSGIACVLNRPALGLDFGDAGPALYLHDLVTQEQSALEFQIGRGVLHLILQFAQQFGEIEIAACFIDDGRCNLPAP